MNQLPIELHEKIFTLCDNIIYIVSLAHVNKHLHKVVSRYAKINSSDRRPNCKYAALTNNVDLLRWSTDVLFPLDTDSCVIAAIKGNLEMLKLLNDISNNRCLKLWYGDIYDMAIKFDHMNIVSWLIGNEEDLFCYDSTDMAHTAHVNCDEILSLCIRYPSPLNRNEFSQNNVELNKCNLMIHRNNLLNSNTHTHHVKGKARFSLLDHAAYSGNLELVKFIKNKLDWEVNKYTYYQAALGGHIHILKWLRDSHKSHWNPNPIWDSDVYYYAMVNGNINVLDWLKFNGCPVDRTKSSKICDMAVLKGGVHLLEWANNNGFPWNINTIAGAAKVGKLEIVKYLRNKGCFWNINTFSYAVSGGHMEVIKWLHENKCPWSQNACIIAMNHNNLEVLKWLVENGCPLYDGACELSVYNGNLEMLKWLHLEKKFPLSVYVYINALKSKHIHILTWLRKNNCPFDQTIVKDAIKTYQAYLTAN